MKVLVVYDSVYGNTERIARAIAGAFSGEVRVVQAGEVSSSELESVDLLVVGAPTQEGRPTPAIKEFLDRVAKPAIEGINVAAFDTRISMKMAKIFGYAAGRIADGLKRKGGILVAAAEGFFVEGTQGPLKEGELERAASWAKGIASAI